ncbi:MAG TPA: PEGA domain-containing protein, partial [Kofleriaceae bacterium]|nr:PEGA domain-containing protein [Kofleriaceae bacterium]
RPRPPAVTPPPAVAAAVDAGVGPPVPPAPALAHLQLDSDPQGATGTVGGKPFGPAPGRIDVAAGDIDIHLELPGRAPYDRTITVGAGQVVPLLAVLPDALARLVVVSHPAGAAVMLDGERLGVTPLDLANLQPSAHAHLTIEAPDLQPASVTIDLVAGETATVERTLRPAPVPLGTIALQVEDGWGDVYLKGKKIGRAPSQLQLPVGRHHLLLRNPPSGREWSLDVDVAAAPKVNFYTTKLGG